MTKKLILPVVAAIMALAHVACNSSSEEYTYETSSSVRVSSFSLAQNSKVLDSLQNVFFSINLEDAKIYNADSLPYGTDVSRLIVTVTTESTVSAVTLEYPRENMTDSVVNYLTNSTDSIDFSQGPVKLRITSQSGLVERVYQVNVNVHTVKPDTLAWNSMATAQLPTLFDKLDAQCTTCFNGVFYSLTQSGNSYCLAKTANPELGEWETNEIALPFTPDINSLRSSDSSLYMLSTDGTLYSSSDFATWQSTGQSWHYIYGNYGDNVIGSKSADGVWKICTYPQMQELMMPADFPVSGTSLPTVYKTNMGIMPQLVMIGGRNADGACLNNAWSYDGESWMDISNRKLPVRLEDATLVAYKMFDVPSTTWTPEEYPVLLVMGGKNDDGVNRDVYYSTDWGLTWREAHELMQLPEDLPSFYKGSAFVYSTTMHVSRSGYEWMPLSIKPLPKNCRFVEPENALSRVTKPITEWECPAIYLFGPTLENGEVTNQVLRARILRFTFLPVY